MRKYYALVPVFSFAPLLLCASLALAASRDEGENAFQSGDYAAAAALFEQAIAAGDTSNATRYNLAASYFRQGDTVKANSNFRLLFDQGFRTADVIYSLAVTEKLLGNTTTAAELFSTVAVNTSALADEALAQLEALGIEPIVTTATTSASKLSSSVQMAAGYNDAIVEIEDGKLVRGGDMYAETYAELAWQRPFANPLGIDLNLSLYNNTYAETDGQDFSLASAGLQQTVAAFDRQLFWTLDFDGSQLDEHGFQQSLNLGAGLEDQNVSSNWRLSYRYRKSFSLNESFDPYAGQHHRVQAEYSFRPQPRHQLTLRAFHEQIDREPVSNAQSTLDLSRNLIRVDMTWAYQLTATALVTAGVNYGDMRADDYQRFIDGTRLQREEDTLGFSLSLRKNFSRTLILQASYNQSTNDSTLSDFTYDQSIYEFGFVWTPSG
jgi:hypothetical protein